MHRTTFIISPAIRQFKPAIIKNSFSNQSIFKKNQKINRELQVSKLHQKCVSQLVHNHKALLTNLSQLNYSDEEIELSLKEYQNSLQSKSLSDLETQLSMTPIAKKELSTFAEWVSENLTRKKLYNEFCGGRAMGGLAVGVLARIIFTGITLALAKYGLDNSIETLLTGLKEVLQNTKNFDDAKDDVIRLIEKHLGETLVLPENQDQEITDDPDTSTYVNPLKPAKHNPFH